MQQYDGSGMDAGEQRSGTQVAVNMRISMHLECGSRTSGIYRSFDGGLYLLRFMFSPCAEENLFRLEDSSHAHSDG